MAAIGISFKTQALYVVVFFARYLDLFTGDFVSIYNTIMKLFFIGSSCYILYLMKVQYKYVAIYFFAIFLFRTYTIGLQMTLRSTPSAWNISSGHPWSWDSSSTTSSPSLRFSGPFQSTSRALPSSHNCSSSSELARRRRSPPTTWLLWGFTVDSTFPTGSTGLSLHYRVDMRHVDVSSIMHSYWTEPDSLDPIAIVAGLVQTGLYLDFFYIYFTR